MKKRRGLFLGVILGLALVVWQLQTQERPITPLLLERDADTDHVEFFLTQFHSWVMDEQGQLVREITGTRLEQYQTEGDGNIWDPIMVLYAEEPAPAWTIQSETAWVSPEGDEILMQGAATMNRPGAEGFEPVTVNSSEVTVFPDLQQATTRQHAHIITPSRETQSIGMSADLSKDTLDMDERARSIYVPQ